MAQPARWTAVFLLAVVALGALAALTTRSRQAELGPETPLESSQAVNLVLWDSLQPARGGTTRYQVELLKAAARFRARHPNVELSIRLFPPAEAERRLREALAAGQPPDVYGSPGPRIFHPGLQVPLTRFLYGEEGEPGLPPGLLAAWTRHGQVWGWPRWADVPLLLARADALDTLGIGSVTAGGRPTWEAILEHLPPRPGEEQPRLLVLYPGAASARTLLLVLFGAPRPTGPGAEATPGRGESSTGPLARQVADLARNGWILGSLEPQGAGQALDPVATLLQGRAALLPAASPLALRLLAPAAGSQSGLPPAARPLILLAPRFPAGYPLLGVSGYVVFRRGPAGEIPRARLAVELARFLSEGFAPGAAGDIGFLPAFPGGWEEWARHSRLSPGETATLEALLAEAAWPAFPGGDPARLGEALAGLLEGRVTPRAFTRFLTEAPGPTDAPGGRLPPSSAEPAGQGRGSAP